MARSRKTDDQVLTSVEVCAGAGGQALGLEQAGFSHQSLVEIDRHSCTTLRLNRPDWNVIEGNIVAFDGEPYRGMDLLAGGLPCPPFSKAGKQLGVDDERNLFPEAVRLIDEIRPRAVLIENVRGFLDSAFESFREDFRTDLAKLGYEVDWKLFNASDFGVSQLRPRVAIVALSKDLVGGFDWPVSAGLSPPTVGELLHDLMAENGWTGAKEWAENANTIAPTVVGGSLKHGGPDLGPTRAKRAWAELGVDGKGIWDAPPDDDFVGTPRLTTRMVARLQGFPDEWRFAGRKTPVYRQIGNAFPPPVARAVGEKIHTCLSAQRVFKVVA